MASASLMSEALTGKTLVEIQEYFELFQQQVTISDTQHSEHFEKLGKLTILAGVRGFSLTRQMCYVSVAYIKQCIKV